MQVLLSIIIPVYNVENFLEECVNSCYQQGISTDNYELILINDGSTDNSMIIAQELSQKHSNIKLLSQDNNGLSEARNVGIKNAQGVYIMFLDSDDWLSKNCFENIFNKLRNESPDVLTFCAANVIDNEYKRRKYYLDLTPITGKELLIRGVEACAPFSIWKKSFLENNNLQFYKGIYHEDEEFTPKAYCLAEKVSLLNEVVYLVRQNPNSITRSYNLKKSYDLINVVCPNLFEFSIDLDSDLRKVFYNRISNLVGGSIANARLANKEEKKLLYSTIYEKNILFKAMIESGKLRHYLMAILCRMYPQNMLFVYDFIQFLLWLPVKIKALIRRIKPTIFYK